MAPPDAGEHVITVSIDETIEAIVDGVLRQLKFGGEKHQAMS